MCAFSQQFVHQEWGLVRPTIVMYALFTSNPHLDVSPRTKGRLGSPGPGLHTAINISVTWVPIASGCGPMRSADITLVDAELPCMCSRTMPNASRHLSHSFMCSSPRCGVGMAGSVCSAVESGTLCQTQLSSMQELSLYGQAILGGEHSSLSSVLGICAFGFQMPEPHVAALTCTSGR